MWLMKSEDNPYFKCLVCGKFVNPAIGHIAFADGTTHWQCHPQLKNISAFKRMSLPNPSLELMEDLRRDSEL